MPLLVFEAITVIILNSNRCFIFFVWMKWWFEFKKKSISSREIEAEIFSFWTHETRNPIYTTSNKPTGKTDRALKKKKTTA